MVWIFRSSTNKKIAILGEEKENIDKQNLIGLWKELKDELDDFSRKYILKRIY
jgi:hypothetical protein